MESLLHRSSGFTIPVLDARYFQILYLGSFLIAGTFLLGWDTSIRAISIILGTAIGIQAVFILFGKAHRSSWMSGMITGLGLCLLLRSGSEFTLFLATAIAISSKFIFKFKGKHLFNPANLGIVSVLLLTENAWVSPGQWGSSILLLFILGVLGSIVVFKVGRLDTTLTFLVSFIVMEYCRSVLYLGWDIDVLFHKLSSGSFMLFAFFMITDPKTSPDHPIGRITWALTIATLAFAMSNWAYIHTAPIWALCIVTPLTAVCDHLWKADRFQWMKEKNLNPHIS